MRESLSPTQMPDQQEVIVAEVIDTQAPESREVAGRVRADYLTRFKPGQSGNPGGRPKKLTRILDAVLDEKDKRGKTVARKLVEAAVNRAIKKSDILMKEVWERTEGKMPSEERGQTNVQVVVMSGR